MSILHARIRRAELASEHARLVEEALRTTGARATAARSVPHDHERAGPSRSSGR